MVQSLGFLGVRTDAFDETVALYRNVLGMTPIHVEADAAWFRAADGSQVHVYGSTNTDHEFFGSAPVVGLVVEDFDGVRQAMVNAGVPFLGEPQRDGGSAWNHYRGPDGNIYEIMGRDQEVG